MIDPIHLNGTYVWDADCLDSVRTTGPTVILTDGLEEYWIYDGDRLQVMTIEANGAVRRLSDMNSDSDWQSL